MYHICLTALECHWTPNNLTHRNRTVRASRLSETARAMHHQWRGIRPIHVMNQASVRFAPAQQGTQDAQSISRSIQCKEAKQARFLERHGKQSRSARASRLPKKARAMHHQCRDSRHNLSRDLVNARKASKCVHLLSTANERGSSVSDSS